MKELQNNYKWSDLTVTQILKTAQPVWAVITARRAGESGSLAWALQYRKAEEQEKQSSGPGTRLVCPRSGEEGGEI